MASGRHETVCVMRAGVSFQAFAGPGCITPRRSWRHSCHGPHAEPSGTVVKLVDCKLKDVPAVASLCGSAFGYGNFPGVESSMALDRLELRFADSVERAVNSKLAEALERKEQSGLAHREHRIRRKTMLLRAQLAELRGDRSVAFPGPESAGDRREVAAWMRGRLFRCVLAADHKGEVMGCVTVSPLRAEAALPPPFPSSAPLRCYVSNMAVSMGARRQGVARRLLDQCERIARLWGYDSIWLHVSVLNTGAQALYKAAGFTVVSEGMHLAGPLRQILLKRDVALPSCRGDGGLRRGAGQVDVEQAPGAGQQEGGVFVWRAGAGRTGPE